MPISLEEIDDLKKIQAAGGYQASRDDGLSLLPRTPAPQGEAPESILTDFVDIRSKQRQASGEEHGYLETVGKGLVRGAEGIASGVGAIGQWAGEATGVEPLAKGGKWMSDYFDKAAKEGWAAPDPYVFRGSFMDRPSLKRAAGIVSEALPSLAAALATGTVAGAGLRAAGAGARAAQLGGTTAGAFGLGALEGAPQYQEAREAGKSIGEASALGAASTIGTGLLEFLPISRMLKPMAKGGIGKYVMRAIEYGGEEAAQEGTQQVFQNAIAKYGYDATRDLAEGLVEAIIGGAGSGAIAGTTSARINRWIEDRRKAGVPDQEISQDIDRIGDALSEDIERHADNVTQAPVTDEITKGADAILRQADMPDEDPEAILAGKVPIEEIPAAMRDYKPAFGGGAPIAPQTVVPQSQAEEMLKPAPADEILADFQAIQAGKEPAAPAPVSVESAQAPAEVAQPETQPQPPAGQTVSENGQTVSGAPAVEPPAGLGDDRIAFIQGKVRQLGSREAVEKLYNDESEVSKYARAVADQVYGPAAQAPGAQPPASTAPMPVDLSPRPVPKAERAPAESNVSTLRGRIRQMEGGGINPVNFKGEFRESGAARFLIKKRGLPIDLAEQQLRDEGWLGKDENLIDVLRDPANLRRGKIAGEGVEKPVSQMTDQEQQIKREMEYEHERPPGKPEDYIQLNAEDLPEGKKITLLEGGGARGWDTYEVVEKDPFEITLKDGKTITLKPMDRVEVRRQDLGEQAPVAAAEVPAEQPEKEPWKQGKNEFIESSKAKLGGKFTAPGSPFGTESEFTTKAAVAHRQHIQQAITDGKPVPAEVLAEYPDLQPKAPAADEAPAAPPKKENIRERNLRLLREHIAGMTEEQKARKTAEAPNWMAEAEKNPAQALYHLQRNFPKPKAEAPATAAAAPEPEKAASQSPQKPDFTKTLKRFDGEETAIPHYVINKEPTLPEGHKVVASQIKQKGTKAYRISVVENPEGERYSHVESGVDERGSFERVDVRFEPLKSDDVEKSAWISQKARQLWEKHKKAEPPALTLQGEQQMPAAIAEMRTRGKKLGEAEQGGLEFGAEPPPAELELKGEKAGGKEADAAKKLTADAADIDEFTTKMMNRGAARVNGVDYKVLQADTGSHYFSRTENGIRVEEGPGYPGKWSRETAIIKASLRAREDFRKAESVPQKSKEPWEMTREEFAYSQNKPKMDAIHKGIAAGKPIGLSTQYKFIPLRRADSIRLTKSGTAQIQRGQNWDNLTDDQLDIMANQAGYELPPLFEKVFHHAAVRDAIEAGKPVPENVRKQYPNLAEQAPESVEEDPALGMKGGPTQQLGNWVTDKIKKRESFTWQELFRAADSRFGGTQAQGKYSVKDAYDAMELGVNRAIQELKIDAIVPNVGAAQDMIRDLEKLIDRLPTQSKRTQEQQEFQQFSTPPPLAYAANWAAGLREDDTYLEPSAGIAGLAVFAFNAGVKTVYANEFSPRRAGILQNFPFAKVFTENAEQLDNVLPEDVQPTVIVMNPPFSATGGRVKNNQTKYGARHIEQALLRLVPGGRLVAIVGKGMGDNMPAFRQWWKKIKAEYNVRANISLNGEGYRKYGTTFDNQLLVIDKTGPTKDNTIVARVEEVSDLIPLLKGVRDDRPEIPAASQRDQRATDQSTRPGAPETAPATGGERQPLLRPASNLGVQGEQARPAGEPGGVDRAATRPGTGEGSGVSESRGATGSERAGVDRAAARGGTEGPSSRSESVDDIINNLLELSDKEAERLSAPAPSAVPTPAPTTSSAPKTAPAPKGATPSEKDLAKAKYEEGKAKVADAIKKFNALFGESGELALGKEIDPDKWAAVREILAQMWDGIKQMAGGAKEASAAFVKEAYSKLSVRGKPYIDKFIREDIRAELEAEKIASQQDAIPKELEYTEQGQNKVETQTEIEDSLFSAYKPTVLAEGAKPHPAKLVQSVAMADTNLPPATYRPILPEKTIKSGKVSDAQLEAVVYANQSFENMLADGRRRGFFIGDGTGVGKGREISAIIQENWLRGRKKAVWISEKPGLMNDATRDLYGIGWDEGAKNLFTFPQAKQEKGAKQEVGPDGKKVKRPQQPVKINKDQGILFATYKALANNFQKIREDQPSTLKDLTLRINQIVDWVGKDFDGVIAFDESHNMKNAKATRGERGAKKPAQQALAGILLQKLLPKARVIYVSATGAVEVENLVYADRLGLWGEGTPFPGADEFLGAIAGNGIAGMEMIARDLKARGVYISRALSFEDVEYDRLVHPLDAEQREAYNTMAKAWQIVFRKIDEAVGHTGGKRSGVMSYFWGQQQRFFDSVVTSMQMPSVIKQARRDIEAGKAVVFQLTKTGKAQLDKATAAMEDGDEYEDLDLSPKEILLAFLKNAFPVEQFEEYTDENGNKRIRLVVDSAGKPVLNAQAVRMRDELLNHVGSIRGIPTSPLDMIIHAFGHDKVAEVTGRDRRLIYKDGKLVDQPWSKAKGEADAAVFMDGKKDILVFSQAGGTGASYHADLDSGNQKPRVHYLLQAGWEAVRAVQGLGRTHRSNQRQAPKYILVTTDINGQMRFISTIARRLDQLGALTKGQRQAGSQGIFQARDNLESTYAHEALHVFFWDLLAGRIPGMSVDAFEAKTGLDITNQSGARNHQMPTVRQFLNRILALEFDEQNKVFDEFSQRIDRVVQRHAENGTLDVGIETITGLHTKKISEREVYTDPTSKAKTKYIEVEVERDAGNIPFDDAKDLYLRDTLYGDADQRLWVRNVKSGRVWRTSNLRSTTNRDGKVKDWMALKGPGNTTQAVDKDILDDREKWEVLTERQAKAAWDDEFKALPKTKKTTYHLLTGALLPIWDRIKSDNSRIYRMQTDSGQRLIGRVIADEELKDVLENLGVGIELKTYTGEELAAQITDHKAEVTLVNGWKIKRVTVSGDDRIEVKGMYWSDFNIYRRDGMFSELIRSDTRYFIPIDNAAEILEKITTHKPVKSVKAGYAGPTLLAKGTAAAPGTAIERRALGATRETVERIQQLVPVVQRAMREAGLPQEVIDLVRVELKPVIDLRGKDVDKTLADWAAEGKEMSAILGATTMRKWSALMELSTEQDLNSLEKTTYHEAFHIAAEWLLPADDYKRVLSHYRTVEGAADSFADFVSRRSGGRQAPVGVVRRAFLKLRSLLQQIGSFLRGKGWASPEDIFGKLAAGEYAPHFGRGDRTTTAFARERMTPVEKQVRDFLMSPSGRIATWAPFRRQVAEWLGVVRPSTAQDYITGQVETPPANWSVPQEYQDAFKKYAGRTERRNKTVLRVGSEQPAAEASILGEILPAHVLPRAQKAIKGIDRGPILEKIKAGLKEAVKTFTPGREYVAMDPKHFGSAYEILRNFKATKQYADRKALDNLREIIDPKNMSKRDYELFTLKIALEDLVRELGEGGKYENWQGMVEKYGELQFGFKSAEEVTAALDKANALVADNQTVREALRRRDSITFDLLKQVVDAKLLPESVLQDRRYFHHQVLEYMNDKFGTGTGAAGLKVGKRGYQFGRIENVKDYSLAYIESEFEVMAHQISQIEKKKNMDEMKAAYDIAKRLEREAKLANYIAVVGGQENYDRLRELRSQKAELESEGGYDSETKMMLKALSDEIWELDPTMPFRQKIARGMAAIGGDKVPGSRYEDSEDLDIDFKMIAELADQGDINARMIFKAMGERNAFIKEALGGRFQTAQSLMRQEKPIAGSQGYTEWVPNPRSAFYLTGSIQDAVAQQIMAGARELQESDIRPVLARGRDETWIIPAELAQALESDQFNIRQHDNIVSKISEATLNGWKRWILLNPMRIAKYNLNNTSGDFDIAFAYDPAILKYSKQAAADLWRWHYDKALSGDLKGELDVALRDEVIGSGMTVHDIPDVRNQEGLRQIVDAMGAGSPSALRTIEKFWQGSKNFTTWRENVLRLAAYRYFKDQIKAGKRVYGASEPAKVDATTEPTRKAALLSRELVGDYGALSQGGQWLRRKMIPFYSWLEINAPRYYRLYKNLAVEGEPRGRELRMGAVAARKGLFLSAKVFAMYAAANMFNHLFWPDEEDELGEQGRRQMHLILGRREDGSIITLRLQGALSDALSWFNLQGFPEDIQQIAAGKKSVLTQLGEGALAPVNKLVQGLRPEIKAPAELIAGRTAYPEFYKPRPIRDRAEYVAQLLSADSLYRRAAGKPLRGGSVEQRVLSDLLSAFTYSADPGETAYYKARDLVNDYLKDHNLERPLADPTNRATALHYYKQAIKFGDAKAAEKYLQQYKEYGGNLKGIESSVKRAHPLGALPNAHRARFFNSLDQEDRQSVKRATEWYRTTYKGGSNA